jgi:NodT family efflux transporter outer membrane factor (OMF) lipoprotein
MMATPFPARLFPLALAVLLAGCSLVPDLHLPQPALPDWWGNAGAAPPPSPGAAAPDVPSTWWQSFGSDELDGLETRALERNHDLKAAISRIAQAEAQAEIAGAPLLPSLSLGSGADLTRQDRAGSSSQSSSTGSRISSRTSRSYQANLTASWEIDFWGKNRAAALAAEAGLAASRLDRDSVMLTLTAGVATGYFQALALEDRIAAARRTLAASRETLDLIEKQAQFGQTSSLEAAQQRSAVALIEAQIPALELQRRQAIDSLAILTGAAPSQLNVERGGLDGIPVPAVAPGLPSDLLRRRPDIRKAEADLAAANANVGVARAELFPSITLTAERGYASSSLSSLLDPASAFWSLGGSLSASLFDNGRLQGNVRLSRAKFDELVESYHGAVLASLKDVEDGLAAVNHLADQEAAQQAAVTAAREAYRLADVRYRNGAVDYLTVLDSQRTLLQAEDGAVQVRLARLNAGVGLFKALGGGMEADGPPGAGQ